MYTPHRVQAFFFSHNTFLRWVHEYFHRQWTAQTVTYNQWSKQTSSHWSDETLALTIPLCSLWGNWESMWKGSYIKARFRRLQLDVFGRVSRCFNIFHLCCQLAARAGQPLEEVNLEDPVWGTGFPFPERDSESEIKSCCYDWVTFLRWLAFLLMRIVEI